MSYSQHIPNPGSAVAIARGCLCPTLDNGHGRGSPDRDEDGELRTAFWLNLDCPLHGDAITNDAA